MTGFDFGMTAGASQSTVRKQLEGNQIYEVTFDGCESRDFESSQKPGQKFKVLEIKFSSDEGDFKDTVWAPNPDTDFEDRPGPYGPQPSNVKAMMLKFKHLIDAVNPELGKKIDSGEQNLNVSAPNPDVAWDNLRQLMVKATAPGVGVKTKIKLIKNNKGDAIFPYFANYNRAGQLYMSTNFIGDNIFWTTKELNKINAANTAKPTSSDSFSLDDKKDETATTAIDYNF